LGLDDENNHNTIPVATAAPPTAKVTVEIVA
jgi:hypothetical protein